MSNRALLPLLLLGMGCAASPPTVPADAGADTPAHANASRTVPADPDAVPAIADGDTTLRVGQLLEIAQTGNASTGYRWEFVTDGAPLLEPAPLPPAADAETPKLVGSPSRQRWRFRAVQPGDTTLRMVYRRPWEQDVEPMRDEAFHIIVQMDDATL